MLFIYLLLQVFYFALIIGAVRNYIILNIVADESKVFSTKERAPYYICLEIYRPEEEEEKNLEQAIVFEDENK